MRFRDIGGTALFAALLMLSWAAPGVCRAGEQAELALRTVRAMVERGEIAPGSTVRLVVKQGNIVSFLGRDNELQREWERATGVPIDASVMPQRPSLEFVRDSVGVDLTVARNHEYADLADAGLIEDLGPELERLGFALPTDPAGDFIRPELQALDGDRVVAIPADFDVGVLYLRKDLLEDPAHRKAYREEFGRELAVPESWDEYLRQVAFFNDPGKGFYGALEPRERDTGWMYWLPRYLAQRAPVQGLFDAEMRPLIDSREGIAATRAYLATVPFSPPEVIAERNDYSFTLPLFLQGRGYSTIITIAGAKLALSPASKIKDRFVVAQLPGVEIGGRLLRRPVIMYGNNLVIPRNAPNKTLALLYAMWLTDPDVSPRSVGVAGGFTDPYRIGHLRDKRIAEVYSRDALDALERSLSDASPAGTGLPGDAEYLAALSENLWRAARGEFGAETAMSRTAASWEQITDRRGREQQIRRWRQFQDRFPGSRAVAAPRADSGLLRP